MSPAQSQALTKRSRDAELMPPPPPPKRIKRPPKVLDEDTYTNALSQIIARDFFPGLLESQTQQEYLDAVESHDNAWIAEAGRRLTAVMTPGPDGRRIRGRRGTSMTPSPMLGTAGETPKGWGGDTPMSVAASDVTTTSKNEAADVDMNMSLSAFQAKYTSEDNESFNALLDKQNVKRREKQRWLWAGNNVPSAGQIAYRTRQQKLLEPSSGDQDKDKQLVLRPTSPDSRPAMPEHRHSQPRNALMFAPESIEDTHQTVFQASEAASNAPPRSVVYDNTRLPNPSQPSDTVPPSPSMSAIDAAIAGRPRPTDSEPGYSGAETPRVNGYAFVDAEPTPSELGFAEGPEHEADTTLLTRLGPTDSTPNPFTINEASRREALHHRMVEKTAKAKRVGSGRIGLAQLQSGITPGGTISTPGLAGATPGRRGENLTPAGEKLLNRLGTPKREGGFDGRARIKSESGLRRGWTPTPKMLR